jgi:hypothetical protein
LSQGGQEVVNINYYEFTKLEEEQETPYNYSRNQISDERKAMLEKQKKLMEFYWSYGIEVIEKWTVEDIIYENSQQKEKDLVECYSSNTAFDNKNTEATEEDKSVFDWASMTQENINKMGELREVMRYTK